MVEWIELVDDTLYELWIICLILATGGVIIPFLKIKGHRLTNSYIGILQQT